MALLQVQASERQPVHRQGTLAHEQLVHIKKRVVVLGLGVARPDEAEFACASGTL